MENVRINAEMTVCNVILSMERPFKISQVIEESEKCGIKNRDLILDVLAQLCESGVIKYSEIEDDVWAYKKMAAFA